MRLPEVARGDRLATRALFRLLSTLTQTRLPDAARAAMYHPTFVGPTLNGWTHEVMRGSSAWTIGERELMAALVAKWNACAFCVGAHRAVAARGIPADVVDTVLDDYRRAQIAPELASTIAFLETMTRTPDALDGDTARAALSAGVSPQQLRDAIDVATVFAIVTRYADALGFEVPPAHEFAKSAGILWKRGYR